MPGGDGQPRRCEVAARTLAEIERVIDRSGIVELIEERITERQARPGRPRQISVRALLIALLANAESGRLFLIQVPGFFDSLPPKTRERLGVTRVGRVTRRQVESLYGLIADHSRTRARGVWTPSTSYARSCSWRARIRDTHKPRHCH